MDLLRAEIRAMRISNYIATGVFLFVAALLALFSLKTPRQVPTIENTASPEFSNQVTTGSELDHIKDRAARRGYYYQSEFSDIMGVSEKTIQRRIDAERLNPFPSTDTEGRIRIELDTEILPAPGR